MGRWYLVRHGQTAWNVEGRIQGHSDIPLSDTGREQMGRLAARLASSSIAAAFASDLSRTTETARLLVQGRDVPVASTPALREQRYGSWEGHTFREIQAQFPEEYAVLMGKDSSFAPPGGESVQDVARRVRAFQAQAREAHQDADVLVVGHAGSIRALVVSLLGLPVDYLWRFKLVPGSLSVVSLYEDISTLDLWNDTSHLGDGRVG